uniref:Putative group ii salivary lipocalin n=1 Tax=Rhipicephalus pulchellus TaxID=72859 RepID=L7LTH2_RHIPC
MTYFLEQAPLCAFLILMLSASAAISSLPTVADDVPDAFQVFGRFPHIVAISDVDNDTIFECLTAKRTEYDPEAKTVTYVAMFKGHHGGKKKSVAFHLSKGPSPNIVEFTEDEHPDHRESAEICYTDYETCYIVRFLYFGQQCFLYVPKGLEDNVPRHCIDHFADICGVVVPTYSRDLCPDDEDDRANMRH